MEEIITSKIAEFGVLGMVVLFFIREFFTYLKSRKIGSGNGNGLNSDVVAALNKLGKNDLEHIKDCINTNNNDLKDSIHSDMKTMIEILGRIEGRLS